MATEVRQPRASLGRLRPVLAALAIAAIAGAGGYVLGGTGRGSSPVIASGPSTPTALASTPKPSPNTYLTAAISPSSFSCSGPSVTTAYTIRLPASAPATTVLYTSAGGAADVAKGVGGGVIVVGSQFEKQADGSWYSFDGDQSMFLCKIDPMGTNTMSLFDEYGNELARVTFFMYP